MRIRDDGRRRHCGGVHWMVGGIAMTNLSHGHSRRGQQTPEYMSWKAMIQRCFNPKNQDYHSYGGAGITVCDRWRTFANFLADMGQKPTPTHEIERVKNDAGYHPENCVWATRYRQIINRGNTIHVTFRGQRIPLVEACASVGLTRSIVIQRIRLGWDIDLALTTPRLAYGQRKPRG